MGLEACLVNDGVVKGSETCMPVKGRGETADCGFDSDGNCVCASVSVARILTQ